jgi:outer membrane protein OmpA-like peptidoglycan-associated protein
MAASTKYDVRTWKARGLAPQHDRSIRADDARRRRRARTWLVLALSALTLGGYGLSRLSLEADASPLASALRSGEALAANLQRWLSIPGAVAVRAPEPPPSAAIAPPPPESPSEPLKVDEPIAAKPIEQSPVAAAVAPEPVRTPSDVPQTPVMVPVPFPIPTPPPLPEVVAAAPPPPPPQLPTLSPPLPPPASPVPIVAPCRAELAPTIAQSIVWFPLASAQLQPAQREMLRDVGWRIAGCKDLKVEVAGHTDTRGTDGNNFQLSWRRAEAVLAVLKEVGVAVDQATIVGYGARTPFQAARGAPDPNALNRRVEFILR